MRFRFRDCELDEPTRLLRRNGAVERVQPKVLDFLIYLLRRPDRITTKEELLDELWPDVAVTEAVISKVLKQARRAVGDDGARQDVIRTFHGRGYRIVAKVRGDEHSASPSAHAIQTNEASPMADILRLRFRAQAFDAGAASALEQALEEVTPNDHGARALLLTRLAAEHCYSDDGHRRLALRHAALDEAQKSGEPGVLTSVFLCPYAQIWDLAPFSRRRQLVMRCADEARAQGRLDVELSARVLLLFELLSLGYVDAFDEEIDCVEALAAKSCLPTLEYVSLLLRASRASLVGHFDEAGELVERSFKLGRRLKGMDVLDIYVAQRLVMGVAEGKADQILALYEPYLTEPQVVSGQCLRIWLLAEAGECGAALERLRCFFAQHGSQIALLPTLAANAAVLASTCSRLGHRPHARELYEVLAPFSGRYVMRGYYACMGPADRFLGQLAALLGEPDSARRHYERAQISYGNLRVEPLQSQMRDECARLCGVTLSP